jgi:Na+-translocating ferredoxin:NAD+ oxidoreductase RnfA subunit
MQSSDVPDAFRGLPVRLLYLAVLAVAFYALTGHSQSPLL